MDDTCFNAEYEFDKQLGIWRRPSAVNFTYSDGDDAENAVYEAIRGVQDRSTYSDELRVAQNDWVLTYHLSSARSNLLRPLEKTLLRNARVLELGCGCGAVTRYLAETAGEVVAVEGSLRRASIAALRCDRLPNVAVVSDLIQDIPEDLGLFDVVTLIGVLEYARIYGGGKSAELRLLQKARSFLRPGGVLILAIENKLGLKYLAGVPEDHMGLSWAGVLETYSDQSVATYSRKELADLLAQAGFDFRQQFAAIPDYKLPTTIIHPEGLACEDDGFRPAALMALRLREFEDLPFFNTQQAWATVCRAGLFADMADSLCFVAVNSGGQEQRDALWPQGVLASHYGVPPSSKYAKEVLIARNPDGFHVARCALYPERREADEPLRQELQDEPYIQGELLIERLRRVMLRKGWTVGQLVDVLRPWQEWLLSHRSLETGRIPSRLMDAAPFNIVVNEDDTLTFIDQEWQSGETASIAAVLLRTLLHSFVRMGPVAEPAERATLSCFDLTLQIVRSFNLVECADEEVLWKDASVLDKLIGSPLTLEEVKSFHLQVMFENTWLPLNLRAVLGQTQTELARTQEELEQTQGVLARTQGELVQTQEALTQAQGALAETQGALAQTQGELAQTQGELEQTQGVLTQTQEELSRTQEVLTQTHGALARTQRELASVYGSRAWRVTYPLRVAADRLRQGRNLVREVVLYRKNHGFFALVRKIAATIFKRESPVSAAAVQENVLPVHDYDHWVKEYDTLSEEDRLAIVRHIQAFAYMPLISVVMPAYETPDWALLAAIESVKSQFYPNWELCIADDASPSPHVIEILRAAAAEDSRIRWIRSETNGNISAASNLALSLASGEFIALLDHDDVLPSHALYEVAAALNKNPDLDIIYSDEDLIDEKGQRHDPHFKTDWNIDLLLGYNMISHLGVYRRELVERLGGFRLGLEGSQDYDLALRCAGATSVERIHHIPAILYHWRRDFGQLSFSERRLEVCVGAARRAIADHLQRCNEIGEVGPHPDFPQFTRVIRHIPSPAPLVSLIIPTRDRADLLERCTKGLLQHTDYPNIELLIVDHESISPETHRLFKQLKSDLRVSILPYVGPFNYPAINNMAVARSRGSILGLINNDIEVIEPGWLSEMVSLAVLPGVGAVGAKLLFPNDIVQHGGVILGPGGAAAHFGHLLSLQSCGYFGRNLLASSISAVTGACLIVKKAIYEEAGGLDEENLAVAFNDVDLCLKIRQKGYRNVWSPHAVLYHHESSTRGLETTPEKAARFKEELDFMVRKWGDQLRHDPFYNVNFSIELGRYFEFAFPPRRVKPWVK